MARSRAFLFLLLLSLLPLWMALGAPAQPETPQAQAYVRSTNPDDYVGSDTCQTCHEDVYKTHERGPHWKTKFLKKGVGWEGCEACHGPGKEHVEGGGDVTKIFRFTQATPQEVSARCLACHEYGEEHANFKRSVHLQNEVGCTNCHQVHQSNPPPRLLAKPQPQLCYTCHLDVRPDFSKPFRHRVNQNLVKCTDCHNPHGGFLTQQLRSTEAQDAVCFKCHTEKAGPFVFEHAPVKTEGCVFCHTPHGSSNPRLLRRSQVNQLCLECHTLTVDSPVPNPPSFHNQAAKYQACTMCHTQIHGSNQSDVFFK